MKVLLAGVNECERRAWRLYGGNRIPDQPIGGVLVEDITTEDASADLFEGVDKVIVVYTEITKDTAYAVWGPIMDVHKVRTYFINLNDCPRVDMPFLDVVVADGSDEYTKMDITDPQD
jgi:hypothetical protein